MVAGEAHWEHPGGLAAHAQSPAPFRELGLSFCSLADASVAAVLSAISERPAAGTRAAKLACAPCSWHANLASVMRRASGHSVLRTTDSCAALDPCAHQLQAAPHRLPAFALVETTSKLRRSRLWQAYWSGVV